MFDSISDNPVFSGDAAAARVGGRYRIWRWVRARAMARVGFLVALSMLAAGCGGDKPDVAAGQTLSDEALKQKCADAQWREKNLGIWYAVCRKPASW